MKGLGRTQKSAINLASGFAFRAVSIVSAFVVRTVFISCLNNSYLSINGLYSSILSMLSLAELGFGTAMAYSMYKPLAIRDYVKLTQLMRLYKKTYRIIGTVILAIGLGVVPFLDVLIKNKPDLPGLTFYYILFLLNSVVSYWFFAYCNSVFQADQKDSTISNCSLAFNIIKSLGQIFVLLFWHNYTLYLLTQIFCTIAQNSFIAVKAHKEYPIFSNRNMVEELPESERNTIFKDVKALMLQKVSFKILNTSDSLLISSLIGVSWVGLLSNYLLIEEAVVAVITQVLVSITASMGNFFVTENRYAGYDLFRKIVFMNYWLYSFSAIALVILLTPFVTLWIGKDYALPTLVVVALISRFFVEGYMTTMSAFRSTLGLFTQGKYLPLVVAGLNIVFSIILSYPLGVAGVLFATPLARCCINVWYMPLVIHRDGFQRSVKPFFIECSKRLFFIVGIALLISLFSHMILKDGVTVLKFGLLSLITIVLPNVLFLLAYRNSVEYKYLRSRAIGILRNLYKSKGV